MLRPYPLKGPFTLSFTNTEEQVTLIADLLLSPQFEDIQIDCRSFSHCFGLLLWLRTQHTHDQNVARYSSPRVYMYMSGSPLLLPSAAVLGWRKQCCGGKKLTPARLAWTE